jgi:hypothetical protein
MSGNRVSLPVGEMRFEQHYPRTRVPACPADVFYLRAHTHGLLRRYLYASMQPCRIACTLDSPIGRGWVSRRPILSFEDAMLFVIDMEKVIKRLPSLDRDMLTRIVIQEYTQAEAACLLGMSVRTISYKFPAALDRLTEKLLEAGLLILPEEQAA